jgi:metacaspase-1
MSNHLPQANKRALCVGINDYPYEGNDLKGCVNDAKAWADVLIKGFGFAKEDVKVVLDSQATRKNILDGLKNLLHGARSGDILVFTNSSHGSYVADDSGDEEKYDEVICPYDIADNHIVDDELRALFHNLIEGVHMTVVLDNCFSGTATRAPVSDILPGLDTPDHRRVRFLSPALRGMKLLRNPWKAAPKSELFPESKMKEILLSGCNDREYSYDAEIGGVFHGALTYYAIAAIRNSNFKLTYSQLHKKVLDTIVDYPQHPQLEGSDSNKNSPFLL